MKRLPGLVAICLLLNVLLCYHALAEEKNSGTLLSIAYDKVSPGKENVVFTLSDDLLYKVFRLGGDKPRLVVDFPATLYRGDKQIPIRDAEFAKALRTGVHRVPVVKTRVVIDLRDTAPVHYTLDYQQDNHIITLSLSGEKHPIDSGSSAGLSKVPEQKAAVKATVGTTAQPASPKVIAPTNEKKTAARKTVDPAKVSKDKEKGAVAKQGVKLIPQIKKISFDDSSNRGEMILFHLNDFFPPTVAAIEKGPPRVICEFADAKVAPDIETDLATDGRYVKRVVATQNTGSAGVRVVLELVSGKDYDLQQVFFKNDNIFVLIVKDLPPDA